MWHMLVKKDWGWTAIEISSVVDALNNYNLSSRISHGETVAFTSDIESFRQEMNLDHDDIVFEE